MIFSNIRNHGNCDEIRVARPDNTGVSFYDVRNLKENYKRGTVSFICRDRSENELLLIEMKGEVVFKSTKIRE